MTPWADSSPPTPGVSMRHIPDDRRRCRSPISTMRTRLRLPGLPTSDTKSISSVSGIGSSCSVSSPSASWRRACANGVSAYVTSVGTAVTRSASTGQTSLCSRALTRVLFPCLNSPMMATAKACLASESRVVSRWRARSGRLCSWASRSPSTTRATASSSAALREGAGAADPPATGESGCPPASFAGSAAGILSGGGGGCSSTPAGSLFRASTDSADTGGGGADAGCGAGVFGCSGGAGGGVGLGADEARLRYIPHCAQNETPSSLAVPQFPQIMVEVHPVSGLSIALIVRHHATVMTVPKAGHRSRADPRG